MLFVAFPAGYDVSNPDSGTQVQERCLLDLLDHESFLHFKCSSCIYVVLSFECQLLVSNSGFALRLLQDPNLKQSRGLGLRVVEQLILS